MKKVLLVTTTLKFGGVERLVIDIAKALAKRGHYYPIVCVLSGDGELLKELADAGIEHHLLDFKNLKNVVRNLIIMRRLIKKLRPDIIHTHQFMSDFYCGIGATGLNISVVSHLHNPKMELFSRKIMRWFLSHFFIRNFIAVVKEMADFQKKLYPKSNIYILPNAIDPRNLALPENSDRLHFRNKWSIPQDAFVIGAAGRLSWEKGYDLLILAFQKFLKRAPNAILVLAGIGPEEGYLRNLARKSGSRVVFVGYQSNIALFLSILDVCAVSSREESFSLTAIEAMWFGIPVLITDTLSSRDLLSPAALVTPCSPEGLQVGLTKLFDDKIIRERMATTGKMLVEQKFLIEIFIKNLESIYEKLLKEQ